MCAELKLEERQPRLMEISDEIYRAAHVARGAQMAVRVLDDDDHRAALDWLLEIVRGGLDKALDMLQERGVDRDE